jgi:hypothetical protein
MRQVPLNKAMYSDGKANSNINVITLAVKDDVNLLEK